MFLPESVLFCIRRLEDAGFRAYAVGGCVRDSLLGLPPQDYDMCTDATPEQIRQVFADCPLVRNGEKHGTIGVILAHQLYEITTFRTEGSYTDNRHPDWVEFVRDIRDDLARRDFTVNAMAYSPTEGYIDPWGGREDLKYKILRAVDEPRRRFTEDALRILRGVRFAVRFGLTPESETEKAMTELAPLMDNLARERVFDELCKLITSITADQLLRFAPIVTQVIPALKPCVGFQQHSPHHAYDVFTHIAHVVEATPGELSLRWAALLHDIGKVPAFSTDETGRGHFYGHAAISAKMAEDILLELKAPTALRQKVVFLIENHMTPLEPDKRLLRRRLAKYGEDGVQSLLALQKADFCSKGIPGESQDFDAIEQALEDIRQEDSCLTIRDLAINGSDLLAIGFTPGPEMGACLDRLLEQVMDEKLPNTKEALLGAAENFLKRGTL